MTQSNVLTILKGRGTEKKEFSFDFTKTIRVSIEAETELKAADGFWLYDETRGMNLDIREKSSTDVVVAALTYYQSRLKEVENAYKSLQTKVDAFVEQVVDKGPDE